MDPRAARPSAVQAQAVIERHARRRGGYREGRGAALALPLRVAGPPAALLSLALLRHLPVRRLPVDLRLLAHAPLALLGLPLRLAPDARDILYEEKCLCAKMK